MKEKIIMNCQDFNAIICFRLFKPSKDRTEKLGLANLKAAFGSLGVPLTDSQAKLLLKRYDNDRDGLLTFTDIQDIFMPREPELKREFKRRLPFDHLRSGQELSYETLTQLRSLFHKTLQTEQNVELLKLEFQKSPDFDINQAFEVINRNNRAGNENFISKEEFQEILRFHGVATGSYDVNNLFDRFDKDRDGRIGYKDFANEMLTVEQHERIKREQIIPYRQFNREQMTYAFPY